MIRIAAQHPSRVGLGRPSHPRRTSLTAASMFPIAASV
jgi:hypothetical protein